jgi:peptide/nickel transport system substrate-binding protein
MDKSVERDWNGIHRRSDRRRLLKSVGATAAIAASATSGAAGVVAAPSAGQARVARSLAQGGSGGTLVVGWEADWDTLDPSKQIGAHANRLARLYGDNLWAQFGDSANILPALAETWAPTDDGRTWHVTLKPGLVFSDNTPCDADAVKYNFDRWLDPNHPFHDPPYGNLTYYLGVISEVEITGDLSIAFHLSSFAASFESNMLIAWAQLVSPTAIETLGKVGVGEVSAGTGPWQVDSWDKGVRVVLSGNDLHWGSQPLLDQLVIVPIVETAQRFNQLQTGEVDMIFELSPEYIPLVDADPNLQVLRTPGLHIWWVELNMHLEPLQDKRVRQALNYAVNKEAIVNEILQGAAAITAGPIIPQSWGNDPNALPYPFDPDRARALLAEAGYPDGFSMKFWVPESGSGMIAPTEIGQVIQANLKDVGVDVEIVTQEWISYLRDWGADGFDKDGSPLYGMAEMSYNVSAADPALWLNVNVRTDAQIPAGWNAGFYANPDVDDLLTKADSTFDIDERAGYYQEAQRIMIDDCPWIFMFSSDVVGAATSRLQGVVMNPDPTVIRLEGAYFED